MADFEDNNPFAGSDTRSEVSSSVDPRPTTISPTGNNDNGIYHFDENNNPDDRNKNSDQDQDDDPDSNGVQNVNRNHQGTTTVSYASRVEQLLAENPDVVISIVDAGKSNEGKFIAYTIKIQDLKVRRRYSEFESLRTTLTKLFPTLIVPPIPEKHSMSDYAVSPTKAIEDAAIIEHRHRMLAVFLNRCCQMPEIRNNSVFQRFLDPNSSWSEVLNSPPVSNLPKSILKAPPLDPSSPTPAHAYLPIPSSSAKLKSSSEALGTGTGNEGDDGISRNDPSTAATATTTDDDVSTFDEIEQNAKEYEAVTVGGLEKVNRRIIKRYSDMATDYNELGARFNAFSLEETERNNNNKLAHAIEKVGQAADNSCRSMQTLVSSLSASFSEPLRESAQFAGVVQSVLKYRRQKSLQQEMTADSLASKRISLQTLERSEQEAQRINHYLKGENDSDEPINTNLPNTTSSTIITETNTATNSGSPIESFPPTVPTDQNKPKKPSSGFKFPGISKLNHAIHGIIDVDPEATRRNNIGKTREQISQLEDALEVAKSDSIAADDSVRQDLERFQQTKEDDLRKIMLAYLQCHIEWAQENLQSWQECLQQVDKL